MILKDKRKRKTNLLGKGAEKFDIMGKLFQKQKERILMIFIENVKNAF